MFFSSNHGRSQLLLARLNLAASKHVAEEGLHPVQQSSVIVMLDVNLATVCSFQGLGPVVQLGEQRQDVLQYLGCTNLTVMS